MNRRVPHSICSSSHSGQPLRSDDGAVEYCLTPVPTGLFVERILTRNDNTRAVLATVFVDRASFNHWCDADATRFDYPLIYMSLRRDGNALLAA